MNPPSAWDDKDALTDYLAGQLIEGRLMVFLGAGISGFYGLPEWGELLAKMCFEVGDDPPKAGDELIKAAAIRTKYFRSKPREFLDLVRRSLYGGRTLDFEMIRKNDTLAAIGSLVMSSKRGSASTIVTLNFDDLLEAYLEFHGFVASPVWRSAHWANNDDVTVYHPHGFLPLDPKREASDDIVLGTQEFLAIMNDNASWRPILQSLLRTHTCLYVGLSGSDIHLQSLLSGLSGSHAISADRVAFHGVRFTTASADDVGSVLRDMGVYTHRMSSYDELPHFLFAICQRARELRKR